MPQPAAASTFGLLVACFLGATGLKLLLVPSYRSTDFEVHRNWLALTYSLPLKQWYYEATSEWTLDYPPFFAFLERALAAAAARLFPHDQGLLRISAEPYASDSTIWFQRGSVMATDLLLLLGVWANAGGPLLGCGGGKGSKPAGAGGGGGGCRARSKRLLLAALTLGSAGLFMVDHMHFQYNGYLMGLLLLSVGSIRQGRPYTGAALFASLLMSKHLFLSLAPAYFLFLLRSLCIPPACNTTFRPLPFLALGLTVLAVFGLALGPFVWGASKEEALAQLQQILARLFPFGRGLVHAYWAPNAYAFYCLADLSLGAVGRRFGVLPPRVAGRANWASGLVQVVAPEALFEVSPLMTAVLTLFSMVPAFTRLWTRPFDKSTFVLALFHCGLCAFMLGWHVHEKAIIVPALLLALLAPADPRYAHLAFWTSTIGHAGLLPLFPPLTADALTAYFLIQAHMLLTWLLTSATHPTALQWPWVETLYFIGLQLTLLFALLIHPWLLAARLPFLARMVCSVYCAVGLLAAWGRSVYLLQSEEEGDAAPAAPKPLTPKKEVAKAASQPAEQEEEQEEAPVVEKASKKKKKTTAATKAKPKAAPKQQQEEKAEAAPAPQRRSRRLREGKAGKGK